MFRERLKYLDPNILVTLRQAIFTPPSIFPFNSLTEKKIKWSPSKMSSVFYYCSSSSSSVAVYLLKEMCLIYNHHHDWVLVGTNYARLKLVSSSSICFEQLFCVSVFYLFPLFSVFSLLLIFISKVETKLCLIGLEMCLTFLLGMII